MGNNDRHRRLRNPATSSGSGSGWSSRHEVHRPRHESQQQPGPTRSPHAGQTIRLPGRRPHLWHRGLSWRKGGLQLNAFPPSGCSCTSTSKPEQKDFARCISGRWLMNIDAFKENGGQSLAKERSVGKASRKQIVQNQAGCNTWNTLCDNRA